MKKAVLTALGILTVACTRADAFESLAAETENTEIVIEVQDPETEEKETESMSERDAKEESQEVSEDTDPLDAEETEETDEWTDDDEAAAESEKDELFVLMVLPCEEAALSVLGEPVLFTEETVICPVLISEDDLEELGEIGEDQIYYWTIAEEEPEVYLRASLIDGNLVFETEEAEEEEGTGTEETQEYEGEDTQAAEAADEDETEESTERSSASTSKKKKSSSSSSSKKSSSKSSSGKSKAKKTSSAGSASTDSSSGHSSSEKKTNSSSGKSSGKHKSRSSADSQEAEGSLTEETEGVGEKEENTGHRTAGRNDLSVKEQEETSKAKQNDDVSGETEVTAEDNDTETSDSAYALPSAAGIGGLLAAAAFAFLRRRNKK